MEQLSKQNNIEHFEAQVCMGFLVQHGLNKLFLDIPQFCKITGFARSTIYQYIREGRFFIPYTVIQKTPYIKTEDFMVWYKSGCITQSKEAP